MISLLKEQFTVTLVEALGSFLAERAGMGARLGSLLYSADLLILDCVPKSGDSPSQRSVAQVLEFLENVASRFGGLGVILVDRGAEGDVERRVRFFEAGVKEYVTYPYGAAELVKIVSKNVRASPS
jgi:hypothetical protein